VSGTVLERGAGRRPPGPSRWEAQRAFLRHRGNPIPFLLATARDHGDVAFFEAGPLDLFLLSHPDDIRDVLVTGNHDFGKGQGLQETKRILGDGLLTSEGDLHRRQRRLIQPLFHHARVAGYAEAMATAADRAADRLVDGAELDVHTAMMELTLAIVGRTLFDTDLEAADAARVRAALSAAMIGFDRVMLPGGELIERLPLQRNRRFREAKGELDGIVYGLIRERRATGDRGDLLSRLLSAQDEDGGGMADRLVRDEAMTIFLAGHETTANALTWTWYLLSQHPDVEARMHREIDEVLADRIPTVEDLARLPYTEMVLSESIRRYPPAWILGRMALRAHPVREYTMPEGSIALVSPYLVHHDPRWYPDPFRFDPERWAPDATAGRPKFSYFPFGGGPRVCIGESFAWMELRLVLATLARQWRFRLAHGARVALLPRVTLRPRFGMPMVSVARSPA
jgi:cytochrome P450